jgi:hypothetical protein
MEGDKEMKAKLERIAGDAGMRKQVRQAALGYGTEEMLPKVKERTPVKSGKLLGTETCKVRVSSKKEDIGIAIIAGGAEAPYARIVHETHKTKSKFIESVILESASTALEGIAKRLDLEKAAEG